MSTWRVVTNIGANNTLFRIVGQCRTICKIKATGSLRGENYLAICVYIADKFHVFEEQNTNCKLSFSQVTYIPPSTTITSPRPHFPSFSISFHPAQLHHALLRQSLFLLSSPLEYVNNSLNSQIIIIVIQNTSSWYITVNTFKTNKSGLAFRQIFVSRFCCNR